MQYEDCSVTACNGEFDRKIHNVANNIHPVIAALFLPKIEILENHFLKSNIANIVKCRFNNEQFNTKEDYELFWSLSRDPNDVICDNKSTISDLFTRALIQNQLWNAVLLLRNGQYYNSSFREFISSIDMCRLNKQDTPDLVYGRYDGTVIKRLLSAFSFRPTVVTTIPTYQLFNTNPYQQHSRPVVTYVPMINLKIPPSINDDTPIDLNDSLEHTQYFFENGAIVPKHTSLIYSREVLFFFVDRRANVINTFNSLEPFSASSLPIGSLGFETINDRDVIFKDKFSIRNDEYALRSVVLCELNNKSQTNKNLKVVIGSSAVVVVRPDVEKSVYSNIYLHYDPYGVIDLDKNPINNTVSFNNPIQIIKETSGPNGDTESFETMARKRGIIFMYQLIKDESVGQFSY